MPTLRELQKRLEVAGTIRQLSGAMRSASTAKYARVSSALSSYVPYAEAMRDIAASVKEDTQGFVSQTVLESGDLPELCILVSGNRGLCGGFHQQLFAFFSDYIKGKKVRVVTAGKKALDFCRAKRIPVAESFSVSDVPAYSEAKQIAEYVRSVISSGEASGVTVCSQRFINMLRSEPRCFSVLKQEEEDRTGKEDGVIFIPDRRSVSEEIRRLILASDLYEILLSSAAGVQSATLVAMRSAYENANSSISSLKVRINRLRQAAVTASVLETSAETKEKL